MAASIDILIERVAERLAELDITERKASMDATGTPDAIRYIRTRRAMPSADRLDSIAETLKTSADWLLGKTGHASWQTPDQLPVKYASAEDGAVALRRIDLSLSMGPGTTIDDYYEEGTFDFDANLLRTITRSPPARLVVASGTGDSMLPTLHDSDVVIIDTTATVLNVMDRIWAISLYGSGGIKRLRASGKTSVEVISDNPDVPNQIVDAEDLQIIGRVVWSARRH